MMHYCYCKTNCNQELADCDQNSKICIENGKNFIIQSRYQSLSDLSMKIRMNCRYGCKMEIVDREEEEIYWIIRL